MKGKDLEKAQARKSNLQRKGQELFVQDLKDQHFELFPHLPKSTAQFSGGKMHETHRKGEE